MAMPATPKKEDRFITIGKLEHASALRVVIVRSRKPGPAS